MSDHAAQPSPPPLWTRHEFPSEDIVVRGVALAFSAANARLSHWTENFERIEPEILDWIDAFEPGSVFYDLGASVGPFALYAAARAGAEVVAFEPEAQNFGTLELNHYLNRRRLKRPFHSLNLAISDAWGLGRMNCRFYGAGEHVKILNSPETRDGAEAFEPAHVQSVLTAPLDEAVQRFALPFPRYMKIDVDGSEIAVLQGAPSVLADPRLKSVFIELTSEDDSLDRADAILKGAGFALARSEPVAHLSGGVYPGLFNRIYERR